MALKLKKTTDSGISTEYHCVKNVTAMDKITVTVDSYTNQTYREKEKENNVKITEQTELYKQLDAEMTKNVDGSNDAKVIELTDGINALGYLSEQSLAVLDNIYEFPLVKGEIVSYALVYSKLKQLPEFNDAIDVMED